MVLRFPLRRPHSWARRSLFWEENWKVPFDDCTHHMQLRIAGVWSISKRNWNSRSFLFPTKNKGDVNKTMTYIFLLLYWAWEKTKKTEVWRNNCWRWIWCFFLYLKLGQGVVGPGPSCYLCRRRVMGNLGTGSCSIGSQSLCMQEPHMYMQCDPEEIENIILTSLWWTEKKKT